MSVNKAPRPIKTDAPHTQEVLNVLANDIGKDGTKKALVKAKRILELAVDPTMGKPTQASDGLLYGLIQSGKTSILTLILGASEAQKSTKKSSKIHFQHHPRHHQNPKRKRSRKRF